jgi:hypothetical protein
MKNDNLDTQRTIRRVLHVAGIVTLGMTLTIAAPRSVHADDRITTPSAPDQIQVESGNRVRFVGHGVGTQNYMCLPAANGVAFKLFTPEATLFNNDGTQQLTTHFFSPNLNPDAGTGADELNASRVTRESSRDTSSVWGQVIASATLATDPAFVDPNAIAWLLVEIVGRQQGSTGGERLTDTTFVQRLHTVGGLAPSTGCASAADIGRQAFMPYTADYVFYRRAK